MVLECPPGYTGSGCIYVCHYPYYGMDCYLQCRCSVENCDFVSGCEDSSLTGKSFHPT